MDEPGYRGTQTSVHKCAHIGAPGCAETDKPDRPVLLLAAANCVVGTATMMLVIDYSGGFKRCALISRVIGKLILTRAFS